MYPVQVVVPRCVSRLDDQLQPIGVRSRVPTGTREVKIIAVYLSSIRATLSNIPWAMAG